jgi:hypothetical protein
MQSYLQLPPFEIQCLESGLARTYKDVLELIRSQPDLASQQ